MKTEKYFCYQHSIPIIYEILKIRQALKKLTNLLTKILDYNEAKSAVDFSDQMSAFSTSLWKTVKCYWQFGFALLLNTAVVNALAFDKLLEIKYLLCNLEKH